jgi:hypothetical protein
MMIIMHQKRLLEVRYIQVLLGIGLSKVDWHILCILGGRGLAGCQSSGSGLLNNLHGISIVLIMGAVIINHLPW